MYQSSNTISQFSTIDVSITSPIDGHTKHHIAEPICVVLHSEVRADTTDPLPLTHINADSGTLTDLSVSSLRTDHTPFLSSAPIT